MEAKGRQPGNKLEDIKKETIFKVPDGYFDRLPMDIQARVASQHPRRSLWVGLWPKRLAIAGATTLLIAIAIGLFLPGEPPKTAEALIAEVSNEAILDFLLESELTTEELMDEIVIAGIDIEFSNHEQSLYEPFEELADEEIIDALEGYDTSAYDGLGGYL